MYRFHPLIGAEVARLRADPPPSRRIVFGFPMMAAENYRAVAELGGGALYDVGCYCVNLARWIYGEPESMSVTRARIQHGVDWHLEATLEFAADRRAEIVASFETEEMQSLEGYGRRPFTDWPAPYDPYRLMVEAFAGAVLAGDPDAPLPLEDSIANLRVLDRLRSSLPA